jgi:DNA-binding response OmpR family regulator
MADCPSCRRPLPPRVFDDQRQNVIATDAAGRRLEHHLPRKPWQLLAALRRRPGQVMERGSLEAALYDHEADYPDSRTIDAHLVRVRRALAGTPYRIACVRGVGWRLDQDAAP